MKTLIKKFVRKFVPKMDSLARAKLARQKHQEKLSLARLSYAQEGEDLIVDRLFDDKKKGFYVDVGAHHPWRFSNTYLFYQKGWRGINIDPRPGIMDLFDEERPGDINLETAIGEKEADRLFYIFNEPALSTFSAEEAAKNDGLRGFYKVVDKKVIRQRRLESVLDEHMPAEVAIDFLSIDVEGLDLEVMRSNNWKKYAPTVVIIEQLGASFESILASEAYRILKGNGYELFSKCVHSIIFKKKNDG